MNTLDYEEVHPLRTNQRTATSHHGFLAARKFLPFACVLTSAVLTFIVYATRYPPEHIFDVTKSPGRENVLQATALHEKPTEIAWLMSFPNSGTSYTMKLVQFITNTTAATNYIEGSIPKRRNSIPLSPEKKSGPFLLSPKRNIPESGYILTKTHCTGYRTRHLLTISLEDFIEGCTLSHRLEDGDKIEVHYDPKRVKRAVHLIRNPFHNAISRFHLQLNEHQKSGDKDWIKTYPKSAEGFRSWCKDYDDNLIGVDKEQSVLSKVLNSDALCHSEFFKYVQWHNNAFLTIDKLDIPVHILHYSDYSSDFDSTVLSLLDFMEQEPVSTPEEFHMSNYDDYYTANEKRKIALLIKELASETAWKQFYDRYFKEILKDIEA